MQRYAEYRTPRTPQSQKADDLQVQNNEGAYSFTPDCFEQLMRFLVLGADTNTYYVGKRDLFRGNYSALSNALKKDYKRAINMIVDVNISGLAPKVDPQIFALAVASVDYRKEVRGAALSHLNDVCRTGTHLFMFVEYRRKLGGGWGTLVRNAIKAWYSKDADKLAYQMIKYRNREGWTHLDILRMVHPKPETPAHDDLFYWAKTNSVRSTAPSLLLDHYALQRSNDVNTALDILGDNPNLPRESIPTEFLKDKEVWRAMLPTMPMTAMVRNLRNMAKYGVLDRKHQDLVVSKLSKEAVQSTRIHPMQFLLALGAYNPENRWVGRDVEWPVSPKIVGALDGAFHDSFKNVIPTGKRILIGLDVSDSMDFGEVATGVNPRMAATAMCLVTLNSEENCDVMAFSTEFKDPGITKDMNIQQAIKKTTVMGFGGTDCSLPMMWAKKNGKKYDAFIIFTDSETWAGTTHPHQALQEYRDKMGIKSKLIVVGMVSNGFTIADPNDPGMLDVVGFDASAPQIMSQFIL